MEDDRIATRRLLNDELRHRLDVQRSSGERVETKATVILGLATTGVPLLLNAGLRSWWLLPAAGAFALAIACSVVVVRIRQSWELDPGSYVDLMWDVDEGTAQSRLVEQRRAAFERNRAELRARIRWWWASVASLVVAAVLTGIHLWAGAGDR
jgi:hypothetical protein